MATQQSSRITRPGQRPITYPQLDPADPASVQRLNPDITTLADLGSRTSEQHSAKQRVQSAQLAELVPAWDWTSRKRQMVLWHQLPLTERHYGEGMSGEIDPRDLRVSDAEREHVGQLLQRAVGEGRITIAEFDSRMAAAMAARTRGELNAQVLDITRVRPKEVLDLRRGMGDIKRRGSWVAPPTIKVIGGVGNTLLDFTEARLTAAVTIIDVKIGVGNLTVVIPAGATVDYDGIHTVMGEVKDLTRNGPSQGLAHFVIRGTVGMGNVKVTHSKARMSWLFRLNRGQSRRRTYGF